MITHVLIDTRPQSVEHQAKADALRILSEYVRSFDTDSDSGVPAWKTAPAPYNQTPIY